MIANSLSFLWMKLTHAEVMCVIWNSYNSCKSIGYKSWMWEFNQPKFFNSCITQGNKQIFWILNILKYGLSCMDPLRALLGNFPGGPLWAPLESSFNKINSLCMVFSWFQGEMNIISDFQLSSIPCRPL